VADPGLELDLGGEDLGRDGGAAVGIEALQHAFGLGDQDAPGVDEEQLLLDPDRQRRRGAEAVLAVRRLLPRFG
jgi:hypothetical protein